MADLKRVKTHFFNETVQRQDTVAVVVMGFLWCDASMKKVGS